MHDDDERPDLPPLNEFVRFGPVPRERCVVCAEPVSSSGIDFGSDDDSDELFWAVLCPCCVGWGIRAVYWAKVGGY